VRQLARPCSVSPHTHWDQRCACTVGVECLEVSAVVCVCVSHVSLSGVRGMQEHYHLYLWTLGCGDCLRQSSPAANAAVFSEQEVRLLVLFCVSTSRSREHRPIASHECESSPPFIVCQKHVFLNHTGVHDGMFIAGDGLQTPLVFFWGSMLHGHFRQTTMALPTRVEPGEPHKL
jgi:hypothetical protein